MQSNTTHFPSGDGTGAPTRLSFIMSSNVKGCFAFWANVVAASKSAIARSFFMRRKTLAEAFYAQALCPGSTGGVCHQVIPHGHAALPAAGVSDTRAVSVVLTSIEKETASYGRWQQRIEPPLRRAQPRSKRRQDCLPDSRAQKFALPMKRGNQRCHPAAQT